VFKDKADKAVGRTSLSPTDDLDGDSIQKSSAKDIILNESVQILADYVNVINRRSVPDSRWTPRGPRRDGGRLGVGETPWHTIVGSESNWFGNGSNRGLRQRNSRSGSELDHIHFTIGPGSYAVANDGRSLCASRAFDCSRFRSRQRNVD